MSQHKRIVQALKRELKKQGKTYGDLAAYLDLSESSVKRMFALSVINLERLDQICSFINLGFPELVLSMEQAAARIECLSVDQEKELVSDTRMLLVAISLMNKWTADEIIDTYEISEFECTQLMAKLDRMNIIELLPGNRVRLKLSRSFEWLPQGPIRRFYERSVKNEYFNSTFDGPGEIQFFVSGMLSRKSSAELLTRLRKLSQDFNELHEEEGALPMEDRFGTSMALSIRPWELDAFHQLRRSGKAKQF